MIQLIKLIYSKINSWDIFPSRYLLDEVSGAKASGGLEVQNLYNVSILNILWKIISGSRFDYRDPKLSDLTQKVNEALTSLGPKFSVTFVMPW